MDSLDFEAELEETGRLGEDLRQEIDNGRREKNDKTK
jgi:hypothetical protein